MKTEKQQALDLIDRLPGGVSTETIISELHFQLTVLRRGQDAEQGENLISHEEARRRLGTWLNSSGT
ncbi:MAG: hypothetical protein WEB52_15490 [Dehalococcoidia bacterium]